MKYDVETTGGRFYGNVFVLPIRIYYEDTDAGGIVYYANYLKFAERARTEFIQALSFNQQEVLSTQKCGFTVRTCHIEYLRPAMLGDMLAVTCEVKEVRGATAIMMQEVWRGDELLATVEVKVAYVDLERKRPVRIPADLLPTPQKQS